MDSKLNERSRNRTFQMGIRLLVEQIEALDRINKLKYHNVRSRTSLIKEAIWQFIERNN